MNACGINTSRPISWRQLVRTIAIAVVLVLAVLVLAEEIRNWLFSPFEPALNWTNDRNNAGAVQAATAVLQVIATVILLGLTWHATATSRQIAEDARHEAALNTRPILTFREERVRVGPFAEVFVRLTNVGQGPALNVEVVISDLVMPYTLDLEGERFMLLSGEEVEFWLASDYDKQKYRLVEAQPKDARRWVPLVKISAFCEDVRGVGWVHGVTLIWDTASKTVRLSNPWQRPRGNEEVA